MAGNPHRPKRPLDIISRLSVGGAGRSVLVTVSFKPPGGRNMAMAILVVIGAVLIGCAAGSDPPTRVSTDTPTPTQVSPTATPWPSPTPEPTPDIDAMVHASAAVMVAAVMPTASPLPTLTPMPPAYLIPPPAAVPTATPSPVPTVVPTATQSPVPTVAPTTTPEPTVAPTATPTATPVSMATVIPTPTAPTPIPGRPGLYGTAVLPEHLAYIWWGWGPGAGFNELEVTFAIHNDVGIMPRGNGIYLMLGAGAIADTTFYFGLQSNAYTGTPPYSGRGKALIFSRWGTRDLELARIPADGWTQSSGHEGDFIGVRRPYAWGPGDYVVRLAPDGKADPDGQWYGLWITDLSTDEDTWVGSMWFPQEDGTARIGRTVYSTVEVYGGAPMRPIDIPEWGVSIDLPRGDGVPARWGNTGYDTFGRGFQTLTSATPPRQTPSALTWAGSPSARTNHRASLGGRREKND